MRLYLEIMAMFGLVFFVMSYPNGMTHAQTSALIGAASALIAHWAFSPPKR